MERIRNHKINPSSAHLATFYIPASETPFDGVLPEETKQMVVADGVGKYADHTLVQVGLMDIEKKAPIGIIYRQEVTYEGYRRGRDFFLEPIEISEGIIRPVPGKRGLWVPIEMVGKLVDFG